MDLFIGLIAGLIIGIMIANKGPKGNDMNPEDPNL